MRRRPRQILSIMTRPIYVLDGAQNRWVSFFVFFMSFASFVVPPLAQPASQQAASSDAALSVDTMPPAAPTGLTATAGRYQVPGTQVSGTQVSLSWTANAEPDLSHYVIYRSASSGFTPTPTDEIGRVNRPGTTFKDINLGDGTYYFRIAAVDTAGNKSSASAQVSATIAPGISLSATSLSFGTVGASGTQTFKVFNTGNSPLKVSSITITGADSSQFTVSPASFTVNAGDSATVTVTLSPTSGGNKSASLSIVHNASGSPATVSLSGAALQAVVDFSANNTTGRVPLSVRFTLIVQNANIRSGSVRWDFGDKETGTEYNPDHLYRAPGVYTVQVEVKTEAGQTLTRRREGFITVSEPPPDVAFSASVTSGRVPLTVLFKITNAGGPVQTYEWNFGEGSPVSTTRDTITHAYRAPGAYTVSLTATGPGGSDTETKADFITVSEPQPFIVVSPTGLSFGDVRVGQSKALVFTVADTGSAALAVLSIARAGADSMQFTVSPTSFTINAGDSIRVTVTFTPSSVGSKSASLSVAHNAAGSPSSVSLSGTGAQPVIAISPADLSFGDVRVGQSKALTLSIGNTGNAALTVSAIARAGADSAQFTVNPTSFTINAGGAAQTVTVTFAPTSEGVKKAMLSVAHNAAGSPSSVALTGSGFKKPDVAYRPDRLSFGNVATGATVQLPIALYNRGNDTLKVASVTGSRKEFTVLTPRPDLVIAPGDSQGITVSYTPSASGDQAGDITVSSNDVDHKTLSIPVSGVGVPLALSVDFNPAEGNQKLTTGGGVRPGKNIPVQLFIEDAPQIKGFTVRIAFDPKMIAFVPGSFAAGPLVPGLIGLANVQKDYVEIGGTTLGGGTGGGSGLLGTLTFEALQGLDKETMLRIPLVVWNRATEGRQAIQTDIQITITSTGGPSPDFDGNGEVDFNDFFLFAAAFGSSDPKFDLDDDGTVGFSDFFLFAEAFGKPAR